MNRHIPSRVLPLALPCLAMICVCGTAGAQIPDKFTNLKVLPRNIAKGDLVATMRAFSTGLGVRCNHCHLESDSTTTPPKIDFARDDRKQKKIARNMMKMVRQINRNYIARSGVESPTEVGCVTCHHGVPRPQTLTGLLQETAQKDGVAAAEKRYRELRERYHGSGAYDFRPGSLNALAEWLAHDRKDLDGAISILGLSVAMDPGAAGGYALLGHLQSEKGDKGSAISSFRKSLELEPGNPRVEEALKKLESGQ